MRYLYLSIVSLTLALLACSSSSAPTDGSKDGGASTQDPNNPSDPTAVLDEAGVPIVDGGRPENPIPTDRASCIADCEKHHTAAKKLSDAIDKECFTGGACEPVCNGLTPGALFTPADVDGGQACDTKTRHAWDIAVPSQKCADCIATTPRCCSLWVDLFGVDQTGASDGQQLSMCTSQCYTKFNK